MPNRPDLSTPRAQDLAMHRKLAAELFNGTWTLMEKPDRTRAENARMIHMAHASAYHWLQVGEPVHFARSHWQCSRMYCELGRAEPAMYHAQFVVDICEQHDIGDWDLAFGYEALSRAHAVAGDQAESRRWREQAESVPIAKAGDRDQLRSDLATIDGS
jgi:hypothetical protein